MKRYAVIGEDDFIAAYDTLTEAEVAKVKAESDGHEDVHIIDREDD